MSPGYLWFDSEFSTDDLDRASLLQVSLVATDGGNTSVTSITPSSTPTKPANTLPKTFANSAEI